MHLIENINEAVILLTDWVVETITRNSIEYFRLLNLAFFFFEWKAAERHHQKKDLDTTHDCSPLCCFY
jgi:hypothetical protein